ncbi:MAG: c-type cytochrome [Pseudomonadota bacterium]
MRRFALPLLLLAACGAQAQSFPEFGEPRLKAGREVWMGSCRLCHAEPESGAPQILDRSAWASRLAKGKEALYRSALEGLVGAKGAEMPARGANPSLSDAQIKAAVDYMTAASQ